MISQEILKWTWDPDTACHVDDVWFDHFVDSDFEDLGEVPDIKYKNGIVTYLFKDYGIVDYREVNF